MRASERARVCACFRVCVFMCACVRKQQLLSKRGVPLSAQLIAILLQLLRFHCFSDNPASVIGRLQFLRVDFLRFSSRVSPVVPSSDHQVSTRGPTNCSPVHTMMVWRQSFWLVKTEPLSWSWVKLRIYFETILIVFHLY